MHVEHFPSCLFCFCHKQGGKSRTLSPPETPKGANPQRVSMEIIIEIKQFNPGRMASHSFIENNRKYMVYPLRDTFVIENIFLLA